MIRISTTCGVALALSFAAGACAGTKARSDGTGDSGGSGTGASGGGTAGRGGVRPDGGIVVTGSGCQHLQCQQSNCTEGACTQHACAGGAKTTVSGTVYDPAGRTPLYNIIVYVPNADLDPIAEGVSCGTCDGTASGQPIASTLTDPTGHFVLDNVPVGSDIPLVIQIGKWRRQISIPSVTACQDNPVADADHSQLRLPRDHNEGHIPRMALTTGHADALECLLRKIGVADSEFTTSAGSGRVHLYYGGDLSGPAGGGAGANSFSAALGGAPFASAGTLWGDAAKLATYDILLLSCEGGQYADAKIPYIANVRAYADRGGRMFTDHLHAYWLNHGLPPWPSTANYIGVGTDLPDPFTSNIDQSFPKGIALAQWLVTVGATTAPPAGSPETIQILQGQYSVAATVPPYTQRWIYTDHNPKDSSMRPAVEYMTMNTPVEAATADQCGRVVFTDLHVVSASAGTAVAQDVSHPETPFPTGCGATGGLSPQEKALEFMFFDLSSCVQPENVTPIPPIIP